MPKVSHTPRAILVDVIPPTMPADVAARRLTELDSLTKTYGGIVVVQLMQKRSVPNYRTYIGSGKVDDIIAIAKQEHADLVIVNNILKPKQMFELGEILRKHQMTVWDRIDLILKIFDKHASTSEAKLQIKLAAIHHMGPRIFGMGMELMQQAGGTGTRGGPGETNTEIMKRHLAALEKTVERQLEDVANARREHRRRRDRIGLKTVSIVGYTNAGKSSLLNALTQKGSYVANALFATLDTRVGNIWIPDPKNPGHGTKLLLSDTIGFIQDLPPQLIRAFQSTLDETVDADLIVHVIDASDPFLHEKVKEVEDILKQLGVANTPKIYVFNKIDLAKRLPKAALKKKYTLYSPTFVSCRTGDGLEELKTTLATQIM